MILSCTHAPVLRYIIVSMIYDGGGDDENEDDEDVMVVMMMRKRRGDREMSLLLSLSCIYKFG